MATKMYPFSTEKHAHDIEFYRNHLYNTMVDMQSGEIPFDKARYDRIYNMYYGELKELTYCMGGACGRVIYLTGKQIALAKKIVAWASGTRAETCIAKGRYDLLKYC